MKRLMLSVFTATALTACSSGGSSDGPSDDSANGGAPSSSAAATNPSSGTMGTDPFGMVYQGDYQLGPVDWAETQFHNSCAPYPDAIQKLYGDYLAGVDQSLNGDGQLCDACALVTTNLGKQVTVHVVTTGVSNHPGDMDLSPEAYNLIYEPDPAGTSDHPRPMSWQLVKCPDLGDIDYQFQTGANTYWTSLWVRNEKVPLTKVEVESANHADWFALDRGTDGTYTDASGFGDGAFQLRLTSLDGQAVTSSLPDFQPGQLATTNDQFK